MLSDKYTECSQCGMVVKSGEYHPYAACLMFMACKDGATVRANLEAVRKQDTELIRQMQDALDLLYGRTTGKTVDPFALGKAAAAITAARTRLENP